MLGLRLRLRTTCATCGNPIPLSAAERDITCPTCEAPKRLGPRELGWITALRPEGGVMPASVEKPDVVGDVNAAPIVCAACGAVIDDHAIEGALARGGIACSCGREISIRAVPATMNDEGWWTAFVGESTGARVGAATAPVRFTCPNCGAPLMVDGTTRTPECGHCATRSYLPDDLWRAVHPIPKAEPFYLWVDPTWYERWLKLKARRVRAVLLTIVVVVLGMAAGGAAMTLFPLTARLLGTSDSGGPVPWHQAALGSMIVSWMAAWAAGVFVARRMRPRRP